MPSAIWGVGRDQGGRGLAGRKKSGVGRDGERELDKKGNVLTGGTRKRNGIMIMMYCSGEFVIEMIRSGSPEEKNVQVLQCLK